MPKMPRRVASRHERAVQEAVRKLRAPKVVDFSSEPKKLERLIDSGQMAGLATLHRLKDGTIGVFAMGSQPADVFAMVCAYRRVLMETHGFTETEPEPDGLAVAEGSGPMAPQSFDVGEDGELKAHEE